MPVSLVLTVMGKKGGADALHCNNQTFNPAYCRTEKTITEQLEEGKRFFGRKYPEMKFLAYFQAYTNTYGEVGEVIRKYEEALAVPDVVGIVIGTRPPHAAGVVGLSGRTEQPHVPDGGVRDRERG